MSVYRRTWERRWVRYLVVYSIVISGFAGLGLIGYYFFASGFNPFNPPLHMPTGFFVGLVIILLDVGGSFAGYFYLTLHRKRKTI